MLTKKNASAGVLLAISMSLFAANVSYAAADNLMVVSQGHALNKHAGAVNQVKADVDPSKLSCQSIRCKNRQIRKIKRANCRLEGGTPSISGHRCTIRPGGW